MNSASDEAPEAGRLLLNPRAAGRRPAALDQAARQFHQGLAGYAPTTLLQLPQLAERLGIDELWAKVENDRFGLPAFKILGASWAVERALRGSGSPRPGVARLVTATDGNHGLAVARVARQQGLAARVYVPAGTTPRRIAMIAAEGAEVVQHPGTYDEAVRIAAEHLESDELLVADTSADPEDRVSSDIVAGYSTLFGEVAEQHPGPFDAVVVGMGVGALAAAAIRYAQDNEARHGVRTTVLGVEPWNAACIQRSLEAGQPVEVPGPHTSLMAGLNCGAPSASAWPTVRDGLDACCTVADGDASEAVRLLRGAGIDVGLTGAAALAGLLRLAANGDLSAALSGPASSPADDRAATRPVGGVVLAVLSEGPTD